MNIVFWTLVGLAMVLVYFALSSIFGAIGNIAAKMWNEFKNNINESEETNNEKR